MIYTILSITGIIVSLFSNILNPNTETIQGLIVCIGLLPICLMIDFRDLNDASQGVGVNNGN